jgi:hypothetical protein
MPAWLTTLPGKIVSAFLKTGPLPYVVGAFIGGFVVWIF